MPTCVHFPDDPNANCTLCKPKPKQGRAIPHDARTPVFSEHTEPGVVAASHYGTCKDCGSTIEPGDDIKYSERRDGWVHAEGCS